MGHHAGCSPPESKGRPLLNDFTVGDRIGLIILGVIVQVLRFVKLECPKMVTLKLLFVLRRINF